MIRISPFICTLNQSVGFYMMGTLVFLGLIEIIPIKSVFLHVVGSQYLPSISFKNSRSEVFCLKDVLKNFTKSTGKHLCQCLSFNKVAGLRQSTGVFLCIS